MPGMDGIKAATLIRETCAVPIIALTANAMSGEEELLKQNGMDALLTKPINPRKLSEILERFLPEDKISQGLQSRPKRDTVEPGNNITGVDLQKGVENSGGTMERYLLVLESFRQNGLMYIRDLGECLERGDLSALIIRVHAIKGAAANIGADELSSTALELELLGKSGDLERARAGLIPFIKSLDAVVQSIENFLK
jgi:CheY-like chemotaxis protein